MTYGELVVVSALTGTGGPEVTTSRTGPARRVHFLLPADLGTVTFLCLISTVDRSPLSKNMIKFSKVLSRVFPKSQ